MSMFRTSVPYGVICALFLIGLFFLSGLFGVNPLIDLSHLFFDVAIFAVFIYFAQRDFKSGEGEGYLHFWQGMSLGFFVYSLTALMFSVVLAVYFLLDPAVLEAYQQEAVVFLESKRDQYVDQYGEEGFQVQLDGIDEVTLMDLWVSSGVKKIIAGFFVTPVISIILRKKPKAESHG